LGQGRLSSRVDGTAGLPSAPEVLCAPSPLCLVRWADLGFGSAIACSAWACKVTEIPRAFDKIRAEDTISSAFGIPTRSVCERRQQLPRIR